MNKITLLLLMILAAYSVKGYAQPSGDGNYFWNLTNITFSINDKTELVLANKDHYSYQINHLDYYHFDLVGYRKLSDHFSAGLGFRINESYKSETWSPGKVYLFYGVWLNNPGIIKIRFANRLAIRTYKISETQYTFDNITNIDFWTHSKNHIPKPYLMDEVFTNIQTQKIQTIRLYGGFRVLKFKNVGLDLFYCYQKTRPSGVWNDYHTYGIITKFQI